jgi:xanthine dehydrogenase accessory factor
MNKQISTWKLIRHSLQNRVAVMLLYVLESNGSSPGRQGFFMCVNAERELSGSIGGGMMEHKFVEMAYSKLKLDEHESIVRRQVHNESSNKDRSGMICSGEQTVFLYRLKKEDLETVDRIIEVLERDHGGTLALTNSGITFTNHLPEEDFLFERMDEGRWRYQEKIGYKNHLYIVGAGHCGLALSKIMSMMDFYIHLYDDRHPLNTFLDNNYVHEKTVLNNYSQLKDIIPSGDHNYVVVMTFGYRSDDVVIRNLLKKQFKYFGVLGSSKKIDKMFKEYDAEGLDLNRIRRIYAPVGLPIKSQTPEEIAVSIAAEIITVKNSKEQFC